MSNDNTIETSQPAPNGAPNGASHGEPRDEKAPTATGGTKEGDTTSHKKKKKKHRHRDNQALPVHSPPPPVVEAVEMPALITTDVSPESPEKAPELTGAPPEPTATTAAHEPEVSLTPPETTTATSEPTEEPQAMQEAPEEAPAPATQTEPLPQAVAEDLRLRMKVWTDRRTGKRYLMPSAFMRDVKNGQPVTDVMYAYAMRDDDTKLVTLTAREWNALPFFYFRQDGPAPRATARPVDVVR